MTGVGRGLQGAGTVTACSFRDKTDASPPWRWPVKSGKTKLPAKSSNGERGGRQKRGLATRRQFCHKIPKAEFMKPSTKPEVISVNDRMPPVNERVIVVCKGSRCLGFLDREKTWRDANRLTELRQVAG